MKQLSFLGFLCLAFCLLCACSKEESLISNSRTNSLANDFDGSISYNPQEDWSGGDVYKEYTENAFIQVSDEATSTFSIDADGASYSNTRRFILDDKQLPPAGAVRTEEMINYFQLDYPFDAREGHTIALNGEVSGCPWNEDHKLIRIGIKGQPIPEAELPPSNFVFLIDVSGSMSSNDKLDLLKRGFKTFVDDGLRSQDRVAIVTYAGSAGVVLESTSGNRKSEIKTAINKLGSGGSTAGAEGIITAYEIAEENFIEGGNNRIIIGTDGDFNVGPSSRDELVELIEEKREKGVYITVLGVGRGNLNDYNLEQIANNGNGTYEYIDSEEQLQKVFVYEASKFFTVAKDVKVQVEFDEQNVQAYRLIGYENRLLNEEDFEDDTKDAGEIGAGQNITALYEIVPQDNLDKNAPTFTIDFRYKHPAISSSIPLTLDIFDNETPFEQATDFMQFTASVAGFSMLLIDSEYKGDTKYNSVLDWLDEVNLSDPHGFKEELREVVKAAKRL